MMMSDTQLLKQQILERLAADGYQSRLFGEGKREGRRIRTTCGLCGGHNLTYLAEGLAAGRDAGNDWHCWDCKQGGDWIKYIALRDGKEAKGAEFWDILRELGQAAGIPVKLDERQQRELAAASAAEAVRNDYRALCLDEARGNTQRWRKVARWLEERGYTAGAFPGGLHASPDPAAALDALRQRGYSDDDLAAAGLPVGQRGGLAVGYGDYAVCIPWYAGSELAGFIWRSVNPEAEPKYLYSRGLKKSASIMNLYAARQLAKEQARERGRSVGIVLVEGVIDALVLTAAGLPTAAIGGSQLSDKQADDLARQHPGGFVVLALDADLAGQGGTLDAVHVLQRVGIQAYIADPANYQGCKDPDELYRKHGAAAVQHAVSEAFYLTAGAWLARRRAAAHPAPTNSHERRELLRAARADLPRLRLGDDRNDYQRELAECTGLTAGDLTAGLAEADDEYNRQQQRDALARAAASITNALRESDDPADALRELAAASAAVAAASVPPLPATYALGDLLADLQRKPAGRTPFFANEYGGQADLTIPAGAITVLSGVSGGGKTTLMLNLLGDWLRNTPGRYVFASYEESRADLALKLIMSLAGVTFQPEAANLHLYREYLTGRAKPGTPEDRAKVDAATALLGDWLASGRLIIWDDPLDADALAGRLGQLHERGGLSGVVIDYIQKIPGQPSGGRSQPRYLDIQAISSRLLRAAVSLDIPLIVGAQLNKEGGTREASDIEFDTALWINIDPPSDADPEQAPVKGKNGKVGQAAADPNELTIDIRKNRGGQSGQKYTIKWNRPARVMNRKGK